jgi:hypothetical protein
MRLNCEQWIVGGPLFHHHRIKEGNNVDHGGETLKAAKELPMWNCHQVYPQRGSAWLLSHIASYKS